MDLTLAWVLGFAGSLHCAGMCGPLVLAFAGGGAGCGGCGQRFTGQVMYNCGRITTYAGLGLLAGAVGAGVRWVGVQQALSVVLGGLIVVSALIALGVVPQGAGAPGRRWAIWYGWVGGVRRALAGLMAVRSLPGQYAVGLVNGLLPCGLVYVACAGAVAAGSWLQSVLWMVMFGLGTVPMMLGLALWGGRLTAAMAAKVRRVVPYCSVVFGLLLVLRGLGLGIPLLSPEFSVGGAASCCPAP